jgi:predicted dienelactone hydrolase
MKKLLFMSLALALLIIPTVAAQRPDAPSYAQRGPYRVGWQAFEVPDSERPLPVSVWYPAEGAKEDEVIQYVDGLILLDGKAIEAGVPDRSAGPYPVVIFSHGSGGTRFQSIFMTEHLASYGFVVVSLDHPGNTILDRLNDPEVFAQNTVVNFALRPLDVLRTIDFLAGLNSEGDLAGLMQLDNIGVSGHSFGGYTALAVAGAQLDLSGSDEFCADNPDAGFCRLGDSTALLAELRGIEAPADDLFPPTRSDQIQAMILYAPASGLSLSPESISSITIPSLVIVGSGDEVTPAESNANPTYEQLGSSQKILMTFANGGHYLFLQSCPPLAISFGLFDQCSDDVWDMARAHDLTNQATVAFFLATLAGDETAQAALAPDQMSFPGIDYQTSNP